MAKGLIDVQTVGHVLWITIVYPQKKNALTRAMYSDFTQALVEAAENPDIAVVCIAGAEGVFSSGNDLADFMEATHAEDFSPVLQFLEVISTFSKPLLAAVSGLAVGIGVTLLLHCDLVYTTPETVFQLPFTRLGLVPEAGATYLLPQIAGYRQAAACLLWGDWFTAAHAVTLGVVNAIVSSDILQTEVQKKADQLTNMSLEALVQTKKMMKMPQAAQVQTQIREEAKVFARLLQMPETHAAIKAAVKK